MAAIRRSTTISPGRAGARLDDFVASWLADELGRELPRSAVRRLVMAGAVAVDGRLARRPGLPLRAGSRVEARVDQARLPPATAGQWGSGATGAAAGVPEVLYRDRWLLAVAKPAGLQVHASADPRRPDLFSVVRAWLAGPSRPGSLPAEAPYLGLHHRLDADTSGVMLFAIDPAANAGLSRAFAGREVEKVYHALVARPAAAPPRRWVERSPLAPTGSGRRARMAAAPADGQPAETAFAVSRRWRHALLVEARPRTGRKHQVRAHLAAAGLPILGDARYGGAASIAGRPVSRAMLHALSLRLSHPVTGDLLEIHCRYPDDFRSLLLALQ